MKNTVLIFEGFAVDQFTYNLCFDLVCTYHRFPTFKQVAKDMIQLTGHSDPNLISFVFYLYGSLVSAISKETEIINNNSIWLRQN